MCVYEYTYTNTHTYIHMQQTHTQKRMALINPFELYVTQCDRDYAALGHADMSFTRWKTIARVRRRIMRSNSCFTSSWVEYQLEILVMPPMYVHMCICMRACTCVYMNMHIHTHIYTHVCTHKHMALINLLIRYVTQSFRDYGPGRVLTIKLKSLPRVRRTKSSYSCFTS